MRDDARACARWLVGEDGGCSFGGEGLRGVEGRGQAGETFPTVKTKPSLTIHWELCSAPEGECSGGTGALAYSRRRHFPPFSSSAVACFGGLEGRLGTGWESREDRRREGPLRLVRALEEGARGLRPTGEGGHGRTKASDWEPVATRRRR